MRKTYEMYFSAGKEPLKFIGNQYSDDDKEIIRQAIKTVESLVNYQDVTKHLVIISGNRQILNFTF